MNSVNTPPTIPQIAKFPSVQRRAIRSQILESGGCALLISSPNTLPWNRRFEQAPEGAEKAKKQRGAP